MSKTFIATFVTMLIMVLQAAKVELPYTNEQITEAIYVIVGILAALKVLYERYLKGGVSYFGFKI